MRRDFPHGQREGHATLERDLLYHPGIRSGEQVDVENLLRDASLIAVPLPCLCDLV